jgi:hypothetical protein
MAETVEKAGKLLKDVKGRRVRRMIEEDPDVEVSPLGGPVSRDGMTVHVEIYRLVEGDESWTLEVTDHQGGSTVWEDRFATSEELKAKRLAPGGVEAGLSV